MMKIRKIKIFCLFIIVFIFGVNGSLVQKVCASKTEEKRVIRIGYYIAPGFQDYDEKKKLYSGASYEYLMALKQYENWEYEFVPVDFSDGVKQLQEGKIDMMNNVSKTSEREKTLSFSSYSSGSNYGCLIVNEDNKQYAFNDFDHFNNLKVGLMTSSIYTSYFEEFCKEHQFHPQTVYYDKDTELKEAMKSGEIDARVVSSSYRDGSRIIAKFAPMDFYFAVPKKENQLLFELNDAMEQVRTDMPNLLQELEQKYAYQYSENSVVLSENEQKLLQEKKKLMWQ